MDRRKRAQPHQPRKNPRPRRKPPHPRKNNPRTIRRTLHSLLPTHNRRQNMRQLLQTSMRRTRKNGHHRHPLLPNMLPSLRKRRNKRTNKHTLTKPQNPPNNTAKEAAENLQSRQRSKRHLPSRLPKKPPKPLRRNPLNFLSVYGVCSASPPLSMACRLLPAIELASAQPFSFSCIASRLPPN